MLVSLILVTAHKESAESIQNDYTYRISLGKNPIQNVVDKEQEFFFRVENYYTDEPVEGLNARFVIYKDTRAFRDAGDELYARDLKDVVANHQGREIAPGIYSATHNFDKKGNYILKARLYGDSERVVIEEVESSITVEPVAPSPFFWTFMGLSLLLGALLARKSHQF